VIVPMARKDEWNAADPSDDGDFLQYVQHPELASLLPPLNPGVFPKLAALNAAGTSRADLVAILLTGIPPGLISGFQNLSSAAEEPADLLRLNVAIPPATSPSLLGLLGGDLAGYPNGRRVFDDVVTIELRAIAGVTFPLIDPSFTPDAAAGLVTDGVLPGPDRYLPAFPYLGTPHSGFDTPSS